MTCADCGAPCQGSICQQCAVEQQYAHLADEVASDSVWDHDDDDSAEVAGDE